MKIPDYVLEQVNEHGVWGWDEDTEDLSRPDIDDLTYSDSDDESISSLSSEEWILVDSI